MSGVKWKEEFFIINSLFGEYLNISHQQMIRDSIYDLRINFDLFIYTALLTVREKKECDYKYDYESMSTMLQDIFLELTDNNNIAFVKGYFPSAKEEEISLLFIRCLWLYHHIVPEIEKNKFSLVMLELPCFDWLDDFRKIGSYQSFNAIILPELSNIALVPLDKDGYPVSETNIITKHIIEFIQVNLRLYSQVFEPVDGRKIYHENDDDSRIIEYYTECLKNFFNGEKKDDIK